MPVLSVGHPLKSNLLTHARMAVPSREEAMKGGNKVDGSDITSAEAFRAIGSAC